MKPDDIPFIVSSIRNEATQRSSTNMSFPKTQFARLPKNIHEEATKNQDKFLNNHLGEVEDFYKFFPQLHSGIFEKWNNKWFRDTGILNHDHFFRRFTK